MPRFTFSKEAMKEKVKTVLIGKRALLYLPEATDYDIYLDFEGHPFLNPESGSFFFWLSRKG